MACLPPLDGVALAVLILARNEVTAPPCIVSLGGDQKGMDWGFFGEKKRSKRMGLSSGQPPLTPFEWWSTSFDIVRTVAFFREE